MINPLFENLLNDLVSDNIERQIDSINKLKELNATETIPTLIEVGLSSDNYMVRDSTVQALGKLSEINSSMVCNSLAKLLKDSEYLIRSDVLDVLADLRCTSAIPEIKKILEKDSEWLVRVSAIEALTHLFNDNDLSIINVLNKALKDSNEVVRSYAAWGIGVLGREEQLKNLEECFALETFLETKVDILAAMYRLGKQEALEKLLEILKNADESIVRLITNIIEELNKEDNSNLKKNVSLIVTLLTEKSILFPSESNHIEQLLAEIED